jgi:hypothetical protein
MESRSKISCETDPIFYKSTKVRYFEQVDKIQSGKISAMKVKKFKTTHYSF